MSAKGIHRVTSILGNTAPAEDKDRVFGRAEEVFQTRIGQIPVNGDVPAATFAITSAKDGSSRNSRAASNVGATKPAQTPEFQHDLKKLGSTNPGTSQRVANRSFTAIKPFENAIKLLSGNAPKIVTETADLDDTPEQSLLK
ncbi:hypothetical protein Trisim1_002745 [Trichoderma cf. simile WF8]